MTIDKNLSFLFKGPPGFAKTCAACSFAAEGPIFLAYWDKKKPVELEKFFKTIIKRPELLNNIEYEIYGAQNANEYLNKLISLTKDCRYVAVVTDSITSMTAGAVNWSLGFKNPGDKNKDRTMPDFDEYKIETSLITQALDISMTLPCHIIWTAHPLPQIKIEGGAGQRMQVSKSNSIVTYGSKVAGMVPGRFTEIYHFFQEIDYNSNPTRTAFKANTKGIGDDFAKTALSLPTDIDFTDKLFFEVWKQLVNKEV